MYVHFLFEIYIGLLILNNQRSSASIMLLRVLKPSALTCFTLFLSTTFWILDLTSQCRWYQLGQPCLACSVYELKLWRCRFSYICYVLPATESIVRPPASLAPYLPNTTSISSRDFLPCFSRSRRNNHSRNCCRGIFYR
jgi:hypothetical protein